MCVTVNNAEHVNETILELPRKLRLKDFIKKLIAAQVRGRMRLGRTCQGKFSSSGRRKGHEEIEYIRP